MKLNKTNVSQVVLPAGKSDYTFFDDDIPGFGLRVRAGGSRAWAFQYRVGSKQRRITFGTVSAMSVQDARERAGQLHAQVKLGQDPFGEKVESQARASETFEKVLRADMAQKDGAEAAQLCRGRAPSPDPRQAAAWPPDGKGRPAQRCRTGHRDRRRQRTH